METYDPRNDPRRAEDWNRARRESPSREPYTEEELAVLRIQYWPLHSVVNSHSVVIWTLLDMLERQRGWQG